MRSLAIAVGAPLEFPLGRRSMQVWPWTLGDLGRLEHALGLALHDQRAAEALGRTDAWQWLALASVRGEAQTSLRRRWRHESFVASFTQAMRVVNGLDLQGGAPAVTDATAMAALQRLARPGEAWQQMTLAQARLALGGGGGPVACASMADARTLLHATPVGDALGEQLAAAWRRVLALAALPGVEPAADRDELVNAVQSLEQAVLRLAQRPALLG
jgi:hypothetical protein